MEPGILIHKFDVDVTTPVRLKEETVIRLLKASENGFKVIGEVPLTTDDIEPQVAQAIIDNNADSAVLQARYSIIGKPEEYYLPFEEI